MTAAGLTHGGFYRHFHSKDELYAEAVRNFLHPDVREPWQKPRPELCDPNVQFGRYVVDAYLSREHLDDLDGSCPLIGLSSDVGRSASGLWPGKVVTEVSPAGAFWEAEPEHKDYLERVPHGYTCHFIRPNWKLPTREEASGSRVAEERPRERTI